MPAGDRLFAYPSTVDDFEKNIIQGFLRYGLTNSTRGDVRLRLFHEHAIAWLLIEHWSTNSRLTHKKFLFPLICFGFARHFCVSFLYACSFPCLSLASCKNKNHRRHGNGFPSPLAVALM